MPDILIPGVPAAQPTLVEPHLDACGAPRDGRSLHRNYGVGTAARGLYFVYSPQVGIKEHKGAIRMKPLFIFSLLVAMVLPVFQQAQADTSSVEMTLTKMERDWAQAGMKNDVAAVDKIVADDWVGIDSDGNAMTKAEAIAEMKSGSMTIQSYEFGPMKVRVFANTAVVTGSDTEKSTYKGKDSSGKYVWTDVYVMRDGRWQAVASQGTKVGK